MRVYTWTLTLSRLMTAGLALTTGGLGLGWMPNVPIALDQSSRQLHHSEPELVAWFFRRRRSSLSSAPRWSYGGAARGGCDPDATPLVPLVPVDRHISNTPAFVGLTADAYPTFYAYVPETDAAAVTFLLKTNTTPQTVVYDTQVVLDVSPAVVRFQVPPDALDPLEVNESYVWTFGLECSPLDPSGNPFVEGIVERVSVSEDETQAIATLPLRDRPQYYAETGLWYETLDAVATLRCTAPHDPTVQAEWRNLVYSLELSLIPELLSQVQPEAIAQAPIAQCGE